MKTVLLAVVCGVLVSSVCLAQAQPRQGPPGPGGRQGWQGAGAMAPEIREKFQKLSSIDQKLAEAEKAAAEKNPDIKTARENLLVLLDEVAKQVRELEEKTDDAVVKASPDLAASVKEKQTILAELEDQMAQYKGRIWLMRLSRVFGAGQGRGGWGQGRMGQPDAGPGAPPAPPAPPAPQAK